MSGNGHLPPDKVRAVHEVLSLGIYPPNEVAGICGVSIGAVYYQRKVLGLDAKRPAKFADTEARLVPHNTVYNYRLCFCSGCYKPAKDGKFCEDHSAPAMTQRVTAGMSEATRRKLMGPR